MDQLWINKLNPTLGAGHLTGLGDGISPGMWIRGSAMEQIKFRKLGAGCKDTVCNPYFIAFQ